MALYSVEQYVKETDGLKAYVNKLKPDNPYNDFDKIYDRVTDSINKLDMYARDLELTCDGLDGQFDILNLIKQHLPTCTTIQDIINLKSMVNLIKYDKFKHYSIHELNMDAYRREVYSNSDYNTQIDSQITSALRFSMNANDLNIFHCNCKNGESLKSFALENDKTFANAIDSSFIKYYNLKEDLTRVITGGLKGAYISNNYFDVVMVTPSIGYTKQINSFGQIAESKEKVEIKNCIKYLRRGGVYIIKIPTTRIDPSLALWLSKALNNVHVIKCEPTIFDEVIIIGQKDIVSKPREEIYQRLKYIKFDDAISIENFNDSFYIPTEELVLEFFRGSKLDLDDIREALNQTTIDNFLEKQTQPLVVKDQSPLLPFNIGQVGLVLTSGCLDGVVEEIDGVYHVIKGMTTKITDTKTEIDETTNNIKSTDTIRNQVKINVFTADGKFISLG